MKDSLLNALTDLCTEKGIKQEVIFDALEAALISAYKKHFNSAQNVSVDINRTTGKIHVYTQKTVVTAEEFVSDQEQIILEEAKKIKKSYDLGDIVNIEVTPANFGRVAAMTAKNVITQRLREAERGITYNEFAEKENDIVSGRISRIERANVFVDIGKLEGLMPVNEQPTNEYYSVGQIMKFYISDVKNASKGTQITLSRTHPGLVRKLFTLEVPEIADGTVEIKSVSREAGSRSKIAVYASNPDVDPQGSCIGPRGARVQAVTDELNGEKIDIVKWSEDPVELITASLSPAEVLSVEINEEEKSAKVEVPENQLSLAIGKSGQNVRLAAKLTGWKIDISAGK